MHAFRTRSYIYAARNACDSGPTCMSYYLHFSRRNTVHLLDTDSNDSLTMVCADPEKHRVAAQ